MTSPTFSRSKPEATAQGPLEAWPQAHVPDVASPVHAPQLDFHQQQEPEARTGSLFGVLAAAVVPSDQSPRLAWGCSCEPCLEPVSSTTS